MYAVWDGYQIELRANDPLYPTDRVYLDEHVIEALIRFWQEIAEGTGDQ